MPDFFKDKRIFYIISIVAIIVLLLILIIFSNRRDLNENTNQPLAFKPEVEWAIPKPQEVESINDVRYSLPYRGNGFTIFGNTNNYNFVVEASSEYSIIPVEKAVLAFFHAHQITKMNVKYKGGNYGEYNASYDFSGFTD